MCVTKLRDLFILRMKYLLEKLTILKKMFLDSYEKFVHKLMVIKANALILIGLDMQSFNENIDYENIFYEYSL